MYFLIEKFTVDDLIFLQKCSPIKKSSLLMNFRMERFVVDVFFYPFYLFSQKNSALKMFAMLLTYSAIEHGTMIVQRNIEYNVYTVTYLLSLTMANYTNIYNFIVYFQAFTVNCHLFSFLSSDFASVLIIINYFNNFFVHSVCLELLWR